MLFSFEDLSDFLFSRKDALLGLSGKGKEAHTFFPFFGVLCETEDGDDDTSVPFLDELDKSSSMEVAGVVGRDTGTIGDEVLEPTPLILASIFDAFNSFEMLVVVLTDCPCPPQAQTVGKGANSQVFLDS